MDNARVLDELWAAVHTGDNDTAARLLGRLPDEFAAGPEGTAMLRAAVEAGDAPVADALVSAGADPLDVWPGGGDALSWAADHGYCPVVNVLLPALDGQHRPAVAAAAELARAWLEVEPEEELWRRLGLPRGGTVDRRLRPCGIGDGAQLVRVTAPDGRTAESMTAHRAVLTQLEHALGAPISREVALRRALHYAEPDSCDWVESVFAVLEDIDPERPFRWAAERLDDPRVDIRRFAADVVQVLSFEPRPFQRAAIEHLRARLEAETDGVALLPLLDAFSNFQDSGPLPEVRRHLGHADPRVRRVVAGILGALPVINEPGSMSALSQLADDPEATVRTVALHTLAETDLDSPAVRALFTAHLDDPDSHARAGALGGLAGLGDEDALDSLWRLVREQGDANMFRHADYATRRAERRRPGRVVA